MPRKIIVIEDEIPVQQMYKFKLEQMGFDVRVANNGKAGLEVSKEFRPDLILLDLRMPEMTGDEMLAKMRATDWGSGIRVVVMTNISRDEAPSALRFLGVDRYIVKAHHTPAQVTEVVDEILAAT